MGISSRSSDSAIRPGRRVEAQAGGVAGRSTSYVIDDPWIDVSIEEPRYPQPQYERRRAPWLALALGLMTAALLIGGAWAALSLAGDGARQLILDPGSTIAGASTTTAGSSTTTTTPQRSRSPEEALFDRALADAGATAAIVADEVDAASRVWEAGAADFATTRSRFMAAGQRATDRGAALESTILPQGTDGDAVLSLVDLFGDLSVAASDAVLGLEAPDDGTLRRNAVTQAIAVATDIERAVANLRSAIPDPAPGEAGAPATPLEPSVVLAADGTLLGTVDDDGSPSGDSRFPAATAAAIAAASQLGGLGDDPLARIAGGGVIIETTIDPALQVHAERVLERWFDGDPSTPKAGTAVIDVDTAAVLVLAERRPDGDIGEHYAIQRRRPGSVFKVYGFLAAVEHGIDPTAPRVATTPVTLDTPAGPWICFDPTPDPDGSASLAEALVASLNTVYCRLAVEVGADRIVEVARRTGISSPIAAIPSVVLGSEKVAPLEMAGSFATIARGGVRIDPWIVARVLTEDGFTLYEHAEFIQRALDPRVARTAAQAMTGVVAAGTGQLADIGRPQGGKTGSPIEGTDAWFVGFTARTSAAVWIGSVDPDRPMTTSVLDGREYPMVYGGPVAAPIWAEIVSEVEAGLPASPLP